MKMIKLTSKNLLKHPEILEQVSQLSLDISKQEEAQWVKPAGLNTKDPMDKDDRYYNAGYILTGYYTAYVLVDDAVFRPINGHKVTPNKRNETVVAMLITNDNDSFANTISLHFMYVVPEYRRHGYGKELMKKFLATVPSTHNVMLSCFWNNTNAMKFYEACGFNRLRATFIRRGSKKKGKKNVH